MNKISSHNNLSTLNYIHTKGTNNANANNTSNTINKINISQDNPTDSEVKVDPEL